MLPDVVTKRQWRTEFLSTCRAAASRHDKTVVQWLKRADDESISFKELGWAPVHLVTLDGKISAALIKQCHGDLGRKVALRNQTSIDEEEQPLSSTQILRLIYESLKTTQSIRTFATVMDLSHLKWLGRSAYLLS